MRSAIAILWILTSVPAAGCDGADEDRRGRQGADTPAVRPGAAAPDTTPPIARPGAAQERPETKQGTIPLEGMEEPFTFRLVRSPERFPLPFTTYIPQDFLVDTVRSGEGDAVRFIANFAGRRNDDAFLEVFFYPAGTTEAEARAMTRAVAERHGRPEERRPEVGKQYPWSLVEYGFAEQRPTGESVLGTVALGRHRGRFFHVVLQYPEEYAEGFVPRAYRVLDEWRWEDTGELLGGPRPPAAREP